MNTSEYVACMTSLFTRLRVKLSEHIKLKILQRNIALFYQVHLGVVEINFVAELLKLYKRIEEQKAAVESYAPPPRKNETLEPDSAWKDVDSVSPCNSMALDSNGQDGTVQKSSRRFWNCQREGHLSTNCQESRRRYCFKYGIPNFTFYSCRIQ